MLPNRDVQDNCEIAINVKMSQVLSLTELEQFVMIYYGGLVAEIIILK